MKKIKLMGLIFLALTLTACKSDRISIADHLSPLIIEYHYNNEVSTKGLSRKEKKLFEEFLESQKLTKKIININEEIGFSDESYDDDENTPGIYKEGDEYFIKYTDLVWEAVDDDFKSHVVLNHKGTLIFRSQFPVLYDETKDKLIYRYRYHNKALHDDYVDYYYRSIGDDSGLIIRYYNDKKGNIKSIKLIYQELFFYLEEGNTKNESIASKALFITVVGFIITGVFVALFIKFNH